jgi:hypothetical protein
MTCYFYSLCSLWQWVKCFSWQLYASWFRAVLLSTSVYSALRADLRSSKSVPDGFVPPEPVPAEAGAGMTTEDLRRQGAPAGTYQFSPCRAFTLARRSVQGWSPGYAETNFAGMICSMVADSARSCMSQGALRAPITVRKTHPTFIHVRETLPTNGVGALRKRDSLFNDAIARHVVRDRQFHAVLVDERLEQ